MTVDNPEACERVWSYPSVVHTSDFNTAPLNGEAPANVKDRFGVDVEVLGTAGLAGASTIVVAGAVSHVAAYLRHLQKS